MDSGAGKGQFMDLKTSILINDMEQRTKSPFRCLPKKQSLSAVEVVPSGGKPGPGLRQCRWNADENRSNVCGLP